MRVLVVGAAGKTGRAVVDQARTAGHEVTAFVHHSDTGELRDVRVHQGDAADRAAVDAVMAGQDAVIDTVGGKLPFQHTTLECSVAQTIIASMRSHGVRRLIVISMIGEGDSVANLPAYERLFFPTFLRGATPDKAAMEEAVTGTELDWVIVRPALLTNGPATGEVHVYSAPTGDKAHVISRPDVAAFLVAQLTSDDHLHQAVTIANH